MTNLAAPSYSVSFTLAGMGGELLVINVQTLAVTGWTPDASGCWLPRAATQDEQDAARTWLAEHRHEWTIFLPWVAREVHG